jgi:2-C-methyl-D-erythritol 4-phosphate cytidylyltransferase/2-C-methyl-D-erythritol 4-phosphate cytidylyltransferase/2-C-methyl-D-erythritol 2,4-cyclodiphosphate synthase
LALQHDLSFNPAILKPEISAILVAAGSSQRMGFDKLAALLDGKPVLVHTVQRFLDCDAITEILVICPPERFDLLDKATFTKPVRRIDGGAERHLSVANGLSAVSPKAEFIAVHDAARPLVSQTDILATIDAAKKHSAASLARRVTETLKRSDEHGLTLSPMSRENLWFIETPQIFRADLIRSAYDKVLKENISVTDETSALETISVKTQLIASTSPNPKITTPADLHSVSP